MNVSRPSLAIASNVYTKTKIVIYNPWLIISISVCTTNAGDDERTTPELMKLDPKTPEASARAGTLANTIYVYLSAAHTCKLL